jgi:hypothetical protein
MDVPRIQVTTTEQAAALLGRIAETLPAIDDVWDFVVEHEDELGGRGIETLLLTLEAASFTEQLLKARNELLDPAECTRGAKK